MNEEGWKHLHVKESSGVEEEPALDNYLQCAEDLDLPAAAAWGHPAKSVAHFLPLQSPSWADLSSQILEILGTL